MIEKAAREADAESLQSIIEENEEVNFPKKELNRALLGAVSSCISIKKNEVIDCITALLDAGANVDAEDPTDGKTALMIACEKGYIEVVDHLINNDAQVDLKDRKQRSPLLYAIEAQGENADVVIKLLKKQADVNGASIDGWTPLLKSTNKQYHEILKHLLSHGASPHHRLLLTQTTALHIACEHGDITSVQKLMPYGAELDAQNRERETPLSIAQRNAHKGGQYEQLYSYLKSIWDEKELKA